MDTPTKSYLLRTNKITAAAMITVTDEAAGYEKANLIDTNQKKTWRSQDVAGQKYITIDFTAPVLITGIGIANSNLENVTTVKVQCDTVSNFAHVDATWTLTINGGLDPFTACYFTHLANANQTKQYWRLGMLTSSDTYFEIGYLSMGEIVELNRQPITSLPYGERHIVEEIEHAGGGETGYKQFSKREFPTLEYKYLTSTLFTPFLTMWRGNEKTIPFFFMLDVNNLDEPIYAKSKDFTYDDIGGSRKNVKWAIAEAL